MRLVLILACLCLAGCGNGSLLEMSTIGGLLETPSSGAREVCRAVGFSDLVIDVFFVRAESELATGASREQALATIGEDCYEGPHTVPGPSVCTTCISRVIDEVWP